MHLIDHSPFGAVLQQPPRLPGAVPNLFTAWRDLWRSLPADIRRDTIDLFLLTPLILDVAALTWVMLP